MKLSLVERPTFEEQSLGYHLGKVKAVQSQNVVEDDCPVVKSAEQGPDPPRHSSRHGHLWG